MPKGHYPHASVPLEDRFWHYVDPLPNGCWAWNGPAIKSGYGQLELPGGRAAGAKRRVVYAHHLALFVVTGAWPIGQVNHTCDRPWCVQPGHLYDGTQRDNVDDMIRRGRYKNAR